MRARVALAVHHQNSMARAATKLAKYRAKRDFARTPEPSGKKRPEHEGHRFVIQKHAARRLHYDFRLERSITAAAWKAVGDRP